MAFSFEEFPWTKYYDSDLRAVLKYMREFAETLEGYDTVISSLQEALEGIEGMESRITALENATGDLASIRTRLTTLENLHSADIAKLQSEIDAIQLIANSVQAQIDSIKVYIDNRDNELMSDYNNKFYQVYVTMYELFYGLRDRLIALAEIVNQIDTSAYNPWARRLSKETVQTNLNYGYADLADLVPTAEEYSELGLTATEYSVYDLTSYEYSVRGKKWLHMDFVYSPVYGFKQNISNVLTSIVNFIKDTLTATEYTALDLDAEAYSELDMTASQYYSFMANEGYLRLGMEGLTASQYSTIGV